MSAKTIIKNPFFIGFVIWLAVGFFLIATQRTDKLHITLTTYNSRIFDQFFYYFTDVGDGLFAVITVLVILIFNRKKAIQAGVSVLTASVLTQFLKKVIFTDSPRPYKFFHGKNLHLIDGMKMHTDFSFPSGHATTVFALFFCLALMTENRIIQSLFFIIAIAAAYSRVYLSQHFFIDILAGSLIGTAIAGIIYLYLDKKINEKYSSPFKFIKN